MVQAQLQQHSNQQQYVHANAEDRRHISDTYNERDKSSLITMITGASENAIMIRILIKENTSVRIVEG